MASNFLFIDTHFPTFSGGENTREIVDSMLNYLKMLTEQLRYTMNNLDATNFNESGLKEIQTDTTAGISEEIQRLAQTVNDLNNSVNSLNGTVRGISQDLGDLSRSVEEMQTTLAKLIAAVAVDPDGNIAIGREDVDVAITGNVTINGIPV